MSPALSKPPPQRETGWVQSRRWLPSSGPRFPLHKILRLDQILGSSPSYDILQSRAGTCLLGCLEHPCWTSGVGLGPLKPCRQQVTPSTAGRVSCFFCPDSRHWKLFRNNKQARNICIRTGKWFLAVFCTDRDRSLLCLKVLVIAKLLFPSTEIRELMFEK